MIAVRTAPPRQAPAPETVTRWDRIGRIAAYGAAVTLTPYVVIKASWVIGSLFGVLPVGTGFNLAGWVLLNTATIGMAVAGIVVALSLVRPWGRRLPGRPLAFCAWVATGFLVPLLPYAVLTSVFQPRQQAAGQQADPAAMPGWEAALVQTGFIGMGLGLLLGLPAYLRRRWPAMFTVRLPATGTGTATGTGNGTATGTGTAPSRRRDLPPAALGIATALAAVVGVFWLSWTAGSRLGVAHPVDADASWRILNGVSGLWAVIMAISISRLRRDRPGRLPRWIPAGAAWIGSGTLFAWSGWKLVITLILLTIRPADVALPENLAVAAVLHALAVVAAAISGLALVRATAAGDHEAFAADTERDMIAE
ncbi:hypothetical protein GCM10009839_15460 [Catenulispora yoronensis]|uniref:DUF4328 domain-containing protein n=1 Tax=Catenulispora yoronensis TaxID=450799 RepID=A0ABP5F834_9ACTN